MKKSLIIIIVAVVLALAMSFGGAYYFYSKSQAEAEAKKIEEENPAPKIVDITDMKQISVGEMTMTLKNTTSKTRYLTTDIIILVEKDEKFETKINDVLEIVKSEIIGVFENKTMEEIQDSGISSFKEPILEAVKGVFPLQEDKDRIKSVHVSKFLIS